MSEPLPPPLYRDGFSLRAQMASLKPLVFFVQYHYVLVLKRVLNGFELGIDGIVKEQ